MSAVKTIMSLFRRKPPSPEAEQAATSLANEIAADLAAELQPEIAQEFSTMSEFNAVQRPSGATAKATQSTTQAATANRLAPKPHGAGRS